MPRQPSSSRRRVRTVLVTVLVVAAAAGAALGVRTVLGDDQGTAGGGGGGGGGGGRPTASDVTPAFLEFDRNPTVHDIDRRAGVETSGVVVSSRDPGVAFVVDDTTGEDRIGVVRTDGSWVGGFEVAGMGAANAEALASGPCRAGAAATCLYIGDLGDHIGREHVTVYRLREPDPGDLPDRVDAAIWRYTYPDGQYDAEALMVDASGNLVVVTKRKVGSDADGVARVYRGKPGGGRLTHVSTVTLPRPPLPAQSLFAGNVVTDATWQPGRVLLLTYDQVIQYVAPSASADPAEFASWPHEETSLLALRQAEGVSVRSRTASPCGFVVAGEGRGESAQIATVGCRG